MNNPHGRRTWRRRLGRALAATVFVAGLWPGWAVLTVPMVAAILGVGTPGTFRLGEYHGGRVGHWSGEFRSDDGRLVLTDAELSGIDNRLTPGTVVRALDNWPRTAYPGQDPQVYPVDGTINPGGPAFVALAWTGLAGWGVHWLRDARRRRLPAPPTPRAHRPPPDPGNVRNIAEHLRRDDP